MYGRAGLPKIGCVVLRPGEICLIRKEVEVFRLSGLPFRGEPNCFNFVTAVNLFTKVQLFTSVKMILDVPTLLA